MWKINQVDKKESKKLIKKLFRKKRGLSRFDNSISNASSEGSCMLLMEMNVNSIFAIYKNHLAFPALTRGYAVSV